jgi:hypothetical protein
VALLVKRSSGAGGSKDMGKVKFFACHKTDHYASQCPEKKKKEDAKVATTTSTAIDEFVEKFKEEFSLVSSLSSNRRFAELEDNGAWIVGSGSSCHMT